MLTCAEVDLLLTQNVRSRTVSALAMVAEVIRGALPLF